MATILSLETSTKNCSVCLAENDRILFLKEQADAQYGHAENLHLFIDEVIQAAGKNYEDLDAVAVSKGPGSYTGLRIGVSAAKGLCYALNIPLIAIDTLLVLAKQVESDQPQFIIPLLDARRLEVYSAVFDEKLEKIKETTAEILDENSFVTFLNQQHTVFLGDGATKCQAIVKHPSAAYRLDVFPSAKEMVLLAFEKFKQSNFEDLAYFEPFYLKDFIAGKPKQLFK